MSRGYIYILTNSSYEKNLLKIGRTSRSPEARAKEIYRNATGIPTPFKVSFKRKVLNCKEAERLIHKRLNSYRSHNSREFFKLPINEAINIINHVCEEIDRLNTPNQESEKYKQNLITQFSFSVPQRIPGYFYLYDNFGKLKYGLTVNNPFGDRNLNILICYKVYDCEAVSAVLNKKNRNIEKQGGSWILSFREIISVSGSDYSILKEQEPDIPAQNPNLERKEPKPSWSQRVMSYIKWVLIMALAKAIIFGASKISMTSNTYGQGSYGVW
ncbi:GIY-YIG nuclease family protein [Nitrosococcus wardiae]|uniref:GIY-YIG nuclease family protein n=1 Tax=Nitrosococcus wardiae TaxID=1814290 RepID=UPI001F0E9D46|nr:GIY-YIG nuclease family protein [Nitrosococcus wardiae]